jgi:hypothetical protein
MRAAGAASVERRRALAAAFSLEVAREGIETARRQALDWSAAAAGGGSRGRGSAPGRPDFARRWGELRLLIEWGCALLRSAPVPSPSKRLFLLASLAIAARQSDRLFVLGTDPGTSENRFSELREQYGAALGHGLHFQSRLKPDPRFELVRLETRYGIRGAAYLISRRLEFTPAEFAEKQGQVRAIVARRTQPALSATDASGRQVSFASAAIDDQLSRPKRATGVRSKSCRGRTLPSPCLPGCCSSTGGGPRPRHW